MVEDIKSVDNGNIALSNVDHLYKNNFFVISNKNCNFFI